MSTEKIYTAYSVTLCMYIILQSEAQIFNCRNKKEKQFWLEGNLNIIFFLERNIFIVILSQ